MGNEKIKVLIVDDSLFFRGVLSKGLNEQPGLEVIGTASNAEEAEQKIKKLNPDVITLDVEMPRMSGLEFLKHQMSIKPIAVVMVSGVSVNVFDTLAAGAVDFVKKPQGKSNDDMALFFQELAGKLKMATKAKLSQVVHPKSQAPRLHMGLPHLSKRNVIAIGASTGGTEAILEVVRDLPVSTPGIVIVQHMPSVFTKMFAERLNKICQMDVKEAENNDQVLPGRILVAAGGIQMKLVKKGLSYHVCCFEGEKVSGHCPSVDVLFQSVAEVAKSDAIGVILTGMGSDGAKGLLDMLKNGAYTIGQDEASCVVYGMPMVAQKLGAVKKQLSIEKIAGEIMVQV